VITSRTELIQRSLELATQWEAAVHDVRGPLKVVAFGSAVRGRRLLQAIVLLGEPHAYEARLQVRAILETYFNYAWIRNRNSHSRATRFLRYEVLHRLRLAEELLLTSPTAAGSITEDVRRMRRQRTRL